MAKDLERTYDVAAGATIQPGAFVGLTTTGYARPYDHGDTLIGIALHPVDNRAGVEGTATITVQARGSILVPDPHRYPSTWFPPGVRVRWWLAIVFFFVPLLGFLGSLWLYLTGDRLRRAAAKIYVAASLLGIIVGGVIGIVMYVIEKLAD